MTDLLPHLRECHPELFSSKGLREVACYPGWVDLLDTLCQSLQRFLYDGGDDHCRRLVAEAEALSLETCGVCGQGASLVCTYGSWAEPLV